MTTVLTRADRESLLAIISGARHFYLAEITKAGGQARQRHEFYLGRIAEADRLAGLLAAKGALTIEDGDEEEGEGEE